MRAAARMEEMLSGLEQRHRRRRLAPRAGHDFASNDYLGLAGSDRLREAAAEALARGVPLGSGGSRLLRGNHEEHEALEREAAAFFGAEAALFFGGGFQANVAIFTALPGAGDLVLHDALIHASVHDGMRLGRATFRAFRHNDAADAERQMREWRAAGGDGQVWIAVESLYSMDGDLADLDAFAALARAEDAVLVVDEAHATGVFGPGGAGLAHGLDAQVLSLHTCGKGLGVSGGLVCGDRAIIEMLVNRGRPFIFATAPSPFDAALVRASLAALRTCPELVAQARARMAHAHAEAARCGMPGPFHSQIIPVILGAEARALASAAALQAQGFDVRAIRPPTVPEGTSRLRVSITGNVDPAAITAVFEAIAHELRACEGAPQPVPA